MADMLFNHFDWNIAVLCNPGISHAVYPAQQEYLPAFWRELFDFFADVPAVLSAFEDLFGRRFPEGKGEIFIVYRRVQVFVY